MSVMSPHVDRLQPSSGVESVLEKTVKTKQEYPDVRTDLVSVQNRSGRK